MTNEEEQEAGTVEEAAQLGWRRPEEGGVVNVDTGRGSAIPARVGASFTEEVSRIAVEAGYGGLFRVYLNSDEIVSANQAPALIETGMAINLMPYFKVA